MKTLKLNGNYWFDENGSKYKWLEDNKLFFNEEDYKYYTTVDRLSEDVIAVELATGTIINEIYADGYDRTFIMECTLADGDTKTEEVVGWYFGKPDPKLTNEYSNNRKLKAEY